MKKKSILLLIPFAAMALTGCGEKKPQCDSAVVSIDQSKVTIAVGGTAKLNASISVEGCSFEWKSSNPEVATVDSTGTVTGVAAGEAVISAGNATCTVTVTSPEVVHVNNIKITNPATLYPNMIVMDIIEIQAVAEPENAVNKALTYTSDHPEIVCVSEEGVMVAVAKGKAIITVASVDVPEVNKKIEVTVSNPTAKTPEETSDGMKLVTEANLKDGDKVVINSVVEDKYFTMPEYSSGKYIASVESSVDANEKLVVNSAAAILSVEVNDSALSFKDSKGRYLHAMGDGNNLNFVDTIDDGCKFQLNVENGISTITCTQEGLEANTLAYNSSYSKFSFYKAGTAATYPKINLYKQDGSIPVPVTAVEFDKDSYEVMVGKTISAAAHVVPLTATEQGITYSLAELSEEGIATIDSSTGALTGAKEGSGKIIATSVENAEIKDEVSFTVAPLGSIVVDKEYGVTADGLGLASYGSGSKDGIVWTQLMKQTDDNPASIQGNNTKNSVLSNELPFSKYIEKVVVKLGSTKTASDANTASFYFGASAECTEEIKVGADTSYPLNVPGSSFEITPTSDSVYFKLVWTKGASYYESLTFKFKDGTVKKLESISATATKELYYVGQSPDKSAIEVTAHYNTGDEVVTDYTVSPVVFTEADEQVPVTVTYEGKTASFNVAVLARTLSSIVVSGDMTNKVYEAGDAFDPTGLTVTANYNNGDTEVVTEGITWSYDPTVATLGVTTVNVTATYMEVSSAAYAVTGLTVNPKTIAVTSVTISSNKYPNIEVDGTHQIVANVEPTDATEQGLTYAVKTGSEEIVSVTDTGLVTGLAKGTGYVVVSSVGDPTKKAEVKVTVSNKTVAIPTVTVDGFSKISSAESLVEGKRMQMYSAYESSIYDIPHYSSGNNIKAELASVTGEQLAAGANVETYILHVNGDGSYSFKTSGGKYLAATGTSSGNYLVEVDSITDNAKFSITFVDGYAQIVCTKTGVAGNTLAFNATNTLQDKTPNPIFSCYKPETASNYAKISLFAKDAEVTAVNLTADASGVIVGNTLQINAEVLPADAKDKSLIWSSDAESVATVSDTGLVTAVGVGSATITATAKNGVAGTYAITVTSGEVELTAIELNKDSTSIVEGGSETLVATLTPNNPTYPNVTWASTDKTVATVDANGVVNAVAPGEATITCTSEHYSSIFDSCIVTVTAKTIDVDKKYELTKDSLKLATTYGDDTSSDIRYNQLMNGSSSIQGNSSKSSKIWNAYAFSKDIKYVKITSAVAKASSNIQMSFGSTAEPTADPITMGKDTEYVLGAGNTFVITSIPANSKFFNLVFNSGAVNLSSIEFGFEEYVQPTAESVFLNKETLEMAVGDADVTLVATVTPSDASRTGEVWESSDTSVATVTNGVVHAVAAGTTNVTYTLNSHVATCAVTVSAAAQGTKAIVDSGTLTGTALTEPLATTIGGASLTLPAGAKKQAVASGAANMFSSTGTILLPSGNEITSGSVPGIITKFEVYLNKGASTGGSAAVCFNNSVITAYSDTYTNKKTSALKVADSVFDFSDAVGTNSSYFCLKGLTKNIQIQLRITYTPFES